MDELLENLNDPLRISLSNPSSLDFNLFRAREKPEPLTRLNQTAIQLMKRLTTDNRLPELPGNIKALP